MALLIQKLTYSLKPSSKLGGDHPHRHRHRHRHHQSEALSASLQAFRSDVLNSLSQLLLDPKPGSLSWIKQCLDLLPSLNRAFAKLVAEINYPMTKWEDTSIEDYLTYSLKLLELLNSISSSVSHLAQARLPLTHALTLLQSSPPSAMKHLKPIQFKNPSKKLKMEGMEEREEKLCSGQEWVIHQALIVMKSTGYWVFGIVLSSLSGDIKPYLEMKKVSSKFFSPPLTAVDSRFYKAATDRNGVPKEVVEVNDAAACLVAAMAAKERNKAAEELGRRLQVMQKLLDVIGTATDGIFTETLAVRTQLLDGLRHHKA